MRVRTDREKECQGQLLKPGWGVNAVLIWSVLGALFAAGMGGCVKVTTGKTADEAVSISQRAAARIRGSWAKETADASPSQKVRLLHSLCLRVARNYIDIGYQAIEKWRDMEDMSGGVVADTDIKKMLDRWVAMEQPVFNAYDDNIRYTFGEIERAGYFGREAVEAIRVLFKQYEKVKRVAFNPTGSPEDFEYILEQLEYETERVGAEVDLSLKALLVSWGISTSW